MEVRPGYKQTEVGVIPEEWDAKFLREVVDFANGKPHENNLKPGGRYFLITLDSIGIEGSLKAQHKETDVWDDSLRKGDLVAVLSDLAHGNLLGLCDLIPEDGKYVLNQRMGRLRLKVAADPLFVRLQINRRQSHFKKRGQGTSQRHIYKRDFDTLEVPFAPEFEQRTIVATLSDVDGLLASLDRLIAKKRDLKQAAMQQLLTGQTRLPGFSEEWEMKRIGDLIEAIADGGTPSTANPHNFGGTINWVVIDDIRDEITTTATTLTDRGLRSCAARLWKPGTLIVSTGATIGEVGIARIPVATKQGICGMSVNQAQADTRFLKYWFVQNKPLLLSKAQGSTIKEVRAPTLVQFEISAPPLPEQTAIAAVLSDMDAELAALEARCDKTRILKQAMKQELLTGKTRLVPAGGAHV